MQRDELLGSQSHEATLNEQPARARPTAYDEAIAMMICERFGEGEMRAIKRRDNGLRQLEHWRDGLGLKTRRLSNLCSAAARNGAAAHRM